MQKTKKARLQIERFTSKFAFWKDNFFARVLLLSFMLTDFKVVLPCNQEWIV